MKTISYATSAMAVICLALSTLTLNAAQIPLPATLDTLLPDGDFVMVGGLKFDSFSYNATGEMPAPTDINVIEMMDGEGNHGIRFQGGFVDLPGGSASDALITFEVSSDGNMISGAHLAANPDLLSGDGLAGVTETFLPGIADESITVFDNGTIEQLSDSIMFGTPTATLNVQKDILLRAADGGAGATLSFVDQTFSMVPEPSSATLLLPGLALLGLIRRKR